MRLLNIIAAQGKTYERRDHVIVSDSRYVVFHIGCVFGFLSNPNLVISPSSYKYRSAIKFKTSYRPTKNSQSTAKILKITKYSKAIRSIIFI